MQLDQKINVKALRYRLFRIQADSYGPKYEDTVQGLPLYIEGLKESIEAMDNFDGWENFNKTWDVYWLGYFKRAPHDVGKWLAGFHSPARILITPLSLRQKSPFNGQMYETDEDIVFRMNLEGPQLPQVMKLTQAEIDIYQKVSGMPIDEHIAPQKPKKKTKKTKK